MQIDGLIFLFSLLSFLKKAFWRVYTVLELLVMIQYNQEKI